jgi:hypothetical protein
MKNSRDGSVGRTDGIRGWPKVAAASAPRPPHTASNNPPAAPPTSRRRVMETSIAVATRLGIDRRRSTPTRTQLQDSIFIRGMHGRIAHFLAIIAL